jgi:NAD(P)-dependent dehydrogenase (short-subunit alcohol dehydrogenase family)
MTNASPYQTWARRLAVSVIECRGGKCPRVRRSFEERFPDGSFGLDETASLLAGRGTDAQRAELDASDRVAVGEYAAVIASTSASCMSSTTTPGSPSRVRCSRPSIAGHERLFAVNLWGVIHGTKAFLPRLVASGDRHLINAR